MRTVCRMLAGVLLLFALGGVAVSLPITLAPSTLATPPVRVPLVNELTTVSLSRRPSPPARPAARQSTVERDVGWCWTGAAAWGRVAPPLGARPLSNGIALSMILIPRPPISM